MNHHILITIVILFFSSASFAAEGWTYRQFGYVQKNHPLKKSEPRGLILGKSVLHAVMSAESSTHAYWGVEQVYLTRDLKKKVFVKYDVELSREQPIGNWSRVDDGYVLHLKHGKYIAAYYALGVNSMELYQLQVQFSKSKKTSQWNNWNPFWGCAHAEVTGAEIKDAPSSEMREASPSYLKRSANVMGCVGSETIDSSWESAKKLWGNASWENVKNGTRESALALWDSVPTWEETKTGFTATGNFLSSTLSDPQKAWSTVKANFEKTKQVIASVYEKIAAASSAFQKLPPEVQDRIICDAVASFAGTGVLGLMLTATGAGATMAAAKLALAVKNYVARIKPMIALIEKLSQSASMGKDKLLKAVDDILKGKKTDKEFANTLAAPPLPEAAVLKLKKAGVSETEIASAQSLLQKMNQGATLNLEESKALAEVLNKAGIRGKLSFHQTEPEVLKKIVESGHMRGSNAEPQIYSSSTYIGKTDNLFVAGKKLGSGTVIFQGQAANLFSNRTVKGFHSAWGRAQGHQVTKLGKLVVEEYDWVDGSLVIKKASMQPLTAVERAKGAVIQGADIISPYPSIGAGAVIYMEYTDDAAN